MRPRNHQGWLLAFSAPLYLHSSGCRLFAPGTVITYIAVCHAHSRSLAFALTHSLRA